MARITNKWNDLQDYIYDINRVGKFDRKIYQDCAKRQTLMINRLTENNNYHSDNLIKFVNSVATRDVQINDIVVVIHTHDCIDGLKMTVTNKKIENENDLIHFNGIGDISYFDNIEDLEYFKEYINYRTYKFLQKIIFNDEYEAIDFDIQLKLLFGDEYDISIQTTWYNSLDGIINESKNIEELDKLLNPKINMNQFSSICEIEEFVKGDLIWRRYFKYCGWDKNLNIISKKNNIYRTWGGRYRTTGHQRFAFHWTPQIVVSGAHIGQARNAPLTYDLNGVDTTEKTEYNKEAMVFPTIRKSIEQWIERDQLNESI